MGIKSINQFLKDKGVPCFIDKYPLSNFSGHRIAIDAANWCYMFMAGEHRDTVFKTRNIVDNDVDRQVTMQKLYNKFLQFNILLMQNGITPIWCWDGIAHDEKGPEREKRKKVRQGRDSKIKELKEKVEAVPAWLRNAKNLGVVPEEMRLAAIEYKEKENELKKLMSTQIFVSYDEMNNIRAIVEGLGIPSIKAEHEGEMLCSQLAVKGKVSGVWSADTDNYAMGTPIIITGFDGYGPGKSTLIKVVSIPYILKSLDITQEQLREFCVMCGCDYNTNIKNYGPKKAFDLLKTHGTIDNVLEHLKKSEIDGSCLNHEVCKDYLTPKDIDVDFSDVNVDIEKFKLQGRDLLHSFSLEDEYDDVRSGMEKIAIKPKINFVE
jgi:flap endonuclease-1